MLTFSNTLCVLNSMGRRSTEDLCHSIADLTKGLSTEEVCPESLRHFIACRLIPLKKEEIKVRPIGIGEVLRRVTT